MRDLQAQKREQTGRLSASIQREKKLLTKKEELERKQTSAEEQFRAQLAAKDADLSRMNTEKVELEAKVALAQKDLKNLRKTDGQKDQPPDKAVSENKTGSQ